MQQEILLFIEMDAYVWRQQLHGNADKAQHQPWALHFYIVLYTLYVFFKQPCDGEQKRKGPQR